MKIDNLKFNDILNKVKKYKTVTFDVFDTLVTRNVLLPINIIQIVSHIADQKFHKKPLTFYNIWCKTVIRLDKIYKTTDYSFNDIYIEILKTGIYSPSQLKYIKKIHLETELKFSIPRLDMLKLYNAVLSLGKRIIIVSDMYFPSSFIKKILNQNGYKKFTRIIVSNEYKLKKYDGKLWETYFKDKENLNSIHIGDNINGDYKQLVKISKPAVKILSSFELFKKTPFDFEQYNNLSSSISNGLIVNKILFNSPFENNTNPFANYFKLGYALYGPVFLSFMIHLCKISKKKKIIFLSREGYYLQKIYKFFVRCIDKKEINNEYVYASRQAILLSNINNFNDIKTICNFLSFSGSPYDFFKNRFDIEISPDYLKTNLFSNKSKVCIDIASKYQNLIIRNSYINRKNYLRYLKNILVKNTMLVDLGYKGTMQCGLSKLTNTPLVGFYLFTRPYYKNGRKYIEMYDDFPFKHKEKYVSVFIDLFETLLKAPHGQFIKMNNKLKPTFRKDTLSKKDLSIRNEVIIGIKQYFADMTKMLPFSLLEVELDKKMIYKNLITFYKISHNGDIPNAIVPLYTYNDAFAGVKNFRLFKTGARCNGKAKK